MDRRSFAATGAGRAHALGRAQQHRRVAVVAAAVEHAVHLRLVVALPHLLHGERVHVGAQQRDRPVAAAEHANDAVAADLLRHLDADRAQLLRHARRGLHLAKRQLRVLVQVPVEPLEVLAVLVEERLDRLLGEADRGDQGAKGQGERAHEPSVPRDQRGVTFSTRSTSLPAEVATAYGNRWLDDAAP